MGTDVNSYKEQDGSVEFWLNKENLGAAQKWVRLKIKANPSIIQLEGIDFIQVQTQECIEKISTGVLSALSELFKKPPENALFIPDKEGQLSKKFAVPSERLHQEYLVRSETIPLTEEVIRNSVKNIINLNKVDEHWLVKVPENSQPLTPLHIKMHERIERIMEKLKAHGRIVYDHCPENAEQICICLKHYHGTVGMSEKVMIYPKLGLDFFKHQNILKATIEDIAEAEYQHLHLYLEEIRYKKENLCIESFEKQLYEGIRPSNSEFNIQTILCAINPQNALKFFEHMKKVSEVAGPINAEGIFRQYGGVQRFIFEAIEKGYPLLGKIHGINTEERDEFHKKVRSYETLEELEPERILDCDHTHRHILKMLSDNSKLGLVHVLELGGDHFKNGSRGVDEPFMIENNERENPFLEQFFEESNLTTSTRLVVFETLGYEDLNESSAIAYKKFSELEEN